MEDYKWQYLCHSGLQQDPGGPLGVGDEECLVKGLFTKGWVGVGMYS